MVPNVALPAQVPSPNTKELESQEKETQKQKHNKVSAHNEGIITDRVAKTGCLLQLWVHRLGLCANHLYSYSEQCRPLIDALFLAGWDTARLKLVQVL